MIGVRHGAVLDTISILRVIRPVGWYEGIRGCFSVATFLMALGKGRQPFCDPVHVCRDKDLGRTAYPSGYDESKRQRIVAVMSQDAEEALSCT